MMQAWINLNACCETMIISPLLTIKAFVVILTSLNNPCCKYQNYQKTIVVRNKFNTCKR